MIPSPTINDDIDVLVDNGGYDVQPTPTGSSITKDMFITRYAIGMISIDRLVTI